MFWMYVQSKHFLTRSDVQVVPNFSCCLLWDVSIAVLLLLHHAVCVKANSRVEFHNARCWRLNVEQVPPDMLPDRAERVYDYMFNLLRVSTPARDDRGNLQRSWRQSQARGEEMKTVTAKLLMESEWHRCRPEDITTDRLRIWQGNLNVLSIWPILQCR